MVGALCFATFMLVFLLGVAVSVSRVRKWWTRYHDWAEERRYPFLWLEFPTLVVAWVLMFWIGWNIFL